MNRIERDLLAIDAANRLEAIDPARSFIIEAPAGAGKTELLTQRFLALLSSVNDPEEIVALTFTNKAAAEMRSRIVGSLESAASQTCPAAEHKRMTYDLSQKVLARDAERQWDLLQNTGRLQITTLDALCGRLARQMPYLSRFGSQPAISTDNDRHYQQAAQDTLALIEGEDATAQAVRRVLAYFDNDANRLQALIQSMLASRDQWLGHTGRLCKADAERALGQLVEDELRSLAEEFSAPLQSTLQPIARFAASQAILSKQMATLPAELEPLVALENWHTHLGGNLDELAIWRGLAALLLTSAGKFRSRFSKETGFGAGEGKAHLKTLKATLDELKGSPVESALARATKLMQPSYAADEWALIEDLVEVVKIATSQLWLLFKETRQVDFTQIAHNALEALGTEESPTDLQLQLDYAINHLLVDEFQDTSPTQVELLTRLTAGWQAEEWRTLFLVGDPMQSIYRFRKADVGLFLKVRDQGIGHIRLNALQLYRNNRSHQEIVEWVNDVFPAVFAGGDDLHKGSVKFAPARATKPGLPTAGAQFHAIIDASRSDTDPEDAPLAPANQQEARQIIALVRTAQAADPAGSIAILVRARTHLESLVTEMRHLDPPIHYQAVEIEALADRQVIQDLVTLTRALHHRADRVHWLALLRAPWCGLTLADLHALAADDTTSSIWQLMHDPERIGKLTPDGQARLKHVRQVLETGFHHQGRQRPRRWVEGVWQCLGGPLAMARPSDAVDVQAFLRLLDQLDEGGNLNLERLNAEMGKLFAAPDPTPGALQIMTIHKSKGLEFDTVILPGLHRKSPPQEKPLLIWDQVLDDGNEETLVVAAYPHGRRKAEGGPSKFDFLRAFEKARSDNEDERVLYVAATRAKRQLHLLGIAKANREDGLKEPGKGTFLSLLWPTARATFAAEAAHCLEEPPAVTPMTEQIDPENFLPSLVRLAAPALSAIFDSHAVDIDDTAANAPEEDAAQAGDDSLAADIGTLVHRYLEMMALDALAGWTRQRLESLTPSFERWLATQGHAPAICRQAAAEVRENLVGTIASDTGRWILGPHEAAGCEVPITSQEDDATQSHIIDRTFVENGVRWIIDYKTSRVSGKNLDEALAEKAETYREQLERYRRLYADEEVRMGIWFSKYATFKGI